MRRAQFGSQAEQVGFLRQLVTAYRSLHTITALARDIVFRQHNCLPKRKLCHALAIGTWVQQNITYVNEGEETFQTPLATLRFRYGDCDCTTTLTASLLESIGIPCELVAVAWADPVRLFGRPVRGPWGKVFGRESFRHIFPRALVPDGGRIRRVPLDATLDHPIEMLTDPVALAAARGVRPRTLVL
jgi:Transglutaminase-like superfamily